jgi:UDP-N-acetylglucosamine 2-epimerase (non-hydrolysing)
MICFVVGARPNFMKMAPVILEARRRQLQHMSVHTGQHYDAAMSMIFFDQLGLPEPDVYLGVGSGSHAEQTAKVSIAFEQVCLGHRPELVVVGGDVNSTLACAVTAAKLCIPVAHVEAGLRSFDRTMPEEINRILTDHVSDLLFTSESSGTNNLLREGMPEEKIHFVGNCMIDSVRSHLASALALEPWRRFGLEPGRYAVLTLHRPAVVDDLATLSRFGQALQRIAERIPLVFPVHPRTRKQIDTSGHDWRPVRLVEPMGYLEFLGLMAKARLVLTDSGGIQEETTVLGVPCLTLRQNTERPVTVQIGTNRVVGIDPHCIVSAVAEELSGSARPSRLPELWDGHAARRVVDAIEHWSRSRREHRVEERNGATSSGREPVAQSSLSLDRHWHPFGFVHEKVPDD